MIRIFLSIFILNLAITVSAQQPGTGVFSSPVVPGPNGTFILATDAAGHAQRPSPGQTFTLLKEDKKGGGFKKLAVLGFPVSAADLEKRLGKPLLQDIVRRQKLKSAQDLFNQLQAGRLDTFGVFSSSTEVASALGMLYIDRKVTRPDPEISYRLERVYNGQTQMSWLVNLGQIRYSPLPRFRRYKSNATDSAALVTWYAVKDHASYATVYSNAGSGTENKFTVASRQFAYVKRDTLFVSFSADAKPGSKLVFFIRPEDIAGNMGPASDTVHLLALRFENYISVRHLTATDTLGSVLLQWDSLPRKAWISGIEVLKSRTANSHYLSIDTLPLTATSYRDHKTIGGNVYYYQLRPILYDLPQKARITPVIAHVRTKNSTRRLPAPQELTAGLGKDTNIRISWTPNHELGIFAYYVLRGTSAGHLQVISPAIRDTVFTDTLKNLRGGITYLYAVAALDMEMHWGDTSVPVAIQSPLSGLVTAPGGMQARATPVGIRLFWNDVSKSDSTVTGYMLYRRKKGDTYFVPVNTVPFPGTYFTDTSRLPAGIYEYGCASVDGFNHFSVLSSLASVNTGAAQGSAAAPLSPPSVFYLRNTATGIEIRVPEAVSPAGTADASAKYGLYRRGVTEKAYRRIGELTTGALIYTDRQVLKDQLYVYALTSKADNAESAKSGEQSIRRK